MLLFSLRLRLIDERFFAITRAAAAIISSCRACFMLCLCLRHAITMQRRMPPLPLLPPLRHPMLPLDAAIIVAIIADLRHYFHRLRHFRHLLMLFIS